MVAVLITAIISGFNNYTKQKLYVRLQKKIENNKKVDVIRNSVPQVLKPKQVLVGDIVFLQEGCEIPADGVVLWSNELTTQTNSQAGSNRTFIDIHSKNA